MTYLPRGSKSLGCGLATLRTRLGPGWVVGGSAATIDGGATAGRAAAIGGGGAAPCTAGGPAATAARTRQGRSPVRQNAWTGGGWLGSSRLPHVIGQPSTVPDRSGASRAVVPGCARYSPATWNARNASHGVPSARNNPQRSKMP